MFTAQIYQCNRGHSSCEDCMDAHRPCGICGNNLMIRNTTLEDHIAGSLVRCPYRDDGCNLVLRLAEFETHLKGCPFQEFKCPAGCYWKGNLKQLRQHFDNVHPELCDIQPGDEILLKDMTDDSQNVFLLVIGTSHFLFHLKISKQKRKIYMTVQCIGSNTDAAEWIYDIHVYNKSESRRKYRFTDVCTSFIEPVDDIFDNDNCSVLACNYASTFINRGAMAFKIFINNSK